MEIKKYFVKMSKDEFNSVRHWLEHLRRNPQRWSNEEVCFLERVSKALDEVQHPYWIAISDLKLDKDGNLSFEEGTVPVLSAAEWKEKIEAFMPEKRSCLATQEELFLYYALCVAKGTLTLEQVSEMPYDGLENYELYGVSEETPTTTMVTPHKLVRKNSIYALVGGAYANPSKKFPMAEVSHVLFETSKLTFTTGVIVLLE